MFKCCFNLIVLCSLCLFLKSLWILHIICRLLVHSASSTQTLCQCPRFQFTLFICGLFLCLIQWENWVQTFCEESASIKDVVYHCCRKSGKVRLNCFHKESPNPNYEPTEVLPVTPVDSSFTSTFPRYQFSFDPNTCQGYATSCKC